MTQEEHRALYALEHVSMRIASAGKRFRNEIVWQRDRAIAGNFDFKITAAQARYLWLLVDLYRRQITDEQLRGWGAHVKFTGELPPIYLEGDHRILEPKKSKKPWSTRPLPQQVRSTSAAQSSAAACEQAKLF
jgi:hypothetical protein